MESRLTMLDLYLVGRCTLATLHVPADTPCVARCFYQKLRLELKKGGSRARKPRRVATFAFDYFVAFCTLFFQYLRTTLLTIWNDGGGGGPMKPYIEYNAKGRWRKGKYRPCRISYHFLLSINIFASDLFLLFLLLFLFHLQIQYESDILMMPMAAEYNVEFGWPDIH